MAGLPWSDLFVQDSRDKQNKVIGNTREKVALFIYLMTCETDYGYNISKNFRKAYHQNTWKGIKSRNLLHPSKISLILKSMQKDGILLTLDEKKELYPFCSGNSLPNNSETLSREYYCINPDVILHPYKMAFSSECLTNIRKALQESESPSVQNDPKKPLSILENLPGFDATRRKFLRKSMSDLELYFHFTLHYTDTENVEDSENSPLVRYDYLQYLSTLTLIHYYGITPDRILKYLNNIPELDYLTVLVTTQFFAEEINRIYSNFQLVIHIRNAEKGGMPVSLEEQKNLKKILAKNRFFTSFKKLDSSWSGIYDAFNPDPTKTLIYHPENSLPLYMLMETNVGMEVKRTRRC